MIIYPAYIDSNLSKREGRKISRKRAVPGPKINEIIKALKDLGIKGGRAESDAAYPKIHWKREGRVLIEDRKGGKNRLLMQVSKEIKRQRTPS